MHRVAPTVPHFGIRGLIGRLNTVHKKLVQPMAIGGLCAVWIQQGHRRSFTSGGCVLCVPYFHSVLVLLLLLTIKFRRF